MPSEKEAKPLLAEGLLPSYSFGSEQTETNQDDPDVEIDIESDNELEVPTLDPGSPGNISKEIWVLSKAAAPCISSSVLQFANKFTMTLFVGHLGSAELAASTLAVMFSNVLGYSICFGLTTALDTLCSQAVTGSQDKRYAGIILQRSIIINLLVIAPIVFIWLNASPLLQVLGQDPVLSDMSGTFLIYLLPSLFPNIIFNAVSKFLQAQGLMEAPFYVLFFTFPINLVLQYLFTWYEPTAIGFYGAPIGCSIADWLAMIGLILYTVFVNGYQCWHPWSIEAFRQWGQYFRLALPGLLMMCAEWWIVEAAALVAGTFGERALAAQSVIINTCAMAYYLFLGISIANANRIGNFLGAGKALNAKFSAYVSVAMAIFLACFNGTIMLALRHVWAHIFTGDPDVATYVAELLPIVCIFQIGDGGSCVTGGILRGSGKQKIGAVANLLAYYVIGLPLGILFTYVLKLNLVGIWWGLSVALLASLGFQFGYIYWGINWEAECVAARERVNVDRVTGPQKEKLESQYTEIDDGSNDEVVD
ncbi:mate-domain-containing protein [Paraphysoderma sedebokerense]|nr:mate-domain-containing protein [Paraphysoderma sedebokerense]